MAITRTSIVDDDGTLTTGTIWNNAYKTELYDQIDAAISAGGLVQTITATGTQNNLSLSAGVTVLRCNNASLLTITGLTAGTSGQQLTIVALNAQVDFTHQDSGSTAANRLFNIATVGKTTILAPGGSARFIYDAGGGFWKLIAHTQGAWLTRTFAAGNYTGGGSMTWTVDSGDVLAERWELNGRRVTAFLALQTTSVGGTLSTALQVALPNGWTAAFAGEGYNAVRASDNNAAYANGLAIATSTVIQVYKDLGAGTNWSAATNSTHIYFTVSFEVQ